MLNMLILKVIYEIEWFLLIYGYEMIVIYKFKYKYKFYIIKFMNIIVYEYWLNLWMYLKKEYMWCMMNCYYFVFLWYCVVIFILVFGLFLNIIKIVIEKKWLRNIKIISLIRLGF